MNKKVLYNILAVLAHVIGWKIVGRLGIEFPYAIYWIGGLSGVVMAILIAEAKKQ